MAEKSGQKGGRESGRRKVQQYCISGMGDNGTRDQGKGLVEFLEMGEQREIEQPQRGVELYGASTRVSQGSRDLRQLKGRESCPRTKKNSCASAKL